MRAGTAWWYGLNHYAPNRHDTGSTSPRSVGEVALMRHTISHFACVDRTFVKSIPSRRRPEKKERIAGEDYSGNNAATGPLNGQVEGPNREPDDGLGSQSTRPRTNTPILAGDAISRHSSPDWRRYEVAVRVASGIACPTTYTVDAGDRTGGDGQGRLTWRPFDYFLMGFVEGYSLTARKGCPQRNGPLSPGHPHRPILALAAFSFTQPPRWRRAERQRVRLYSSASAIPSPWG